MKSKTCPTCKKEFTGMGALSRKDNKTEICSQCGTIEALADTLKIKEDFKSDRTSFRLTDDQVSLVQAMLSYFDSRDRNVLISVLEEADLQTDDDMEVFASLNKEFFNERN